MMIELQCRVIGLDIDDLIKLALQMKWVKVKETEGKTKFDCIKATRLAMEEEVGQCKGDQLENLLEKIRTILDQLKLNKNQGRREKKNYGNLKYNTKSYRRNRKN